MSVTVKQYTPLSKVLMVLMANMKGNRDYDTTLGDFVKGMSAYNKVQAPEGEYVFTPKGLAQLAKDRLGIPPAIFDNSGIRPETKLAIMHDLADAAPDKVMRVRIAGQQVHAVMSDDYKFYDNVDLLEDLIRMQDEGLLPAETQAMSYNISPDGRDMHLRIVSPDLWDFVIDEGSGRMQPYHGNLILSNNEIKMASFAAQVAITRTSCTNSTIGQALFKQAHRGGNGGDDRFYRKLQESLELIKRYTNEMAEHMRDLRNIKVDSPVLIFEKVKEEFGIPTYALNHAEEYWRDHGSGDSVYDVVQALSAGTRTVTQAEGRRRENWTERTLLERHIGTMVETLRGMHANGERVEDWYLTGERAWKEAAARYVLGYSDEFKAPETAVRIADELREMEF